MMNEDLTSQASFGGQDVGNIARAAKIDEPATRAYLIGMQRYDQPLPDKEVRLLAIRALNRDPLLQHLERTPELYATVIRRFTQGWHDAELTIRLAHYQASVKRLKEALDG